MQVLTNQSFHNWFNSYGDSKLGVGCCNGVELAQGGSVTNRSSINTCNVRSPAYRQRLSYVQVSGNSLGGMRRALMPTVHLSLA